MVTVSVVRLLERGLDIGLQTARDSFSLRETAECPKHTDRHFARITMCSSAASVGVRAVLVWNRLGVWVANGAGEGPGVEMKFS